MKLDLKTNTTIEFSMLINPMLELLHQCWVVSDFKKNFNLKNFVIFIFTRVAQGCHLENHAKFIVKTNPKKNL